MVAGIGYAVASHGLPSLPAFLEKGGWDIFRVFVFATEAAEGEVHDEDGGEDD